MPSNPNIALSVKAPQFRSPLDTFARAQQIASNNMAMQKAQREAAAVNAMQTYLKGGGKLETAADIQTAAQAGVDPSVAQKIAEQNLNLGKFGVEQKKIVTERLFNRLGAVARAGEQGDSAPWVNFLNDYSLLGDEEFREASELLNMTKGRYDAPVVKSLMAGAQEYFKKTTPQAQAEIIQNEAGDFFEGRIGGVTPGGAYRLEEYEQEKAPVKTEVETGEPFNIRDGGMGGPYTNDTADILDGIVSAQNDRDYQDALALVERANPDMVAALRRAMPRFDPTRIKGIRAAFSSAFGGAPDQPSLVVGERGTGAGDIPMVEGGRGGPLEGYTSTGRQLRGRSPVQGQTPGIYNVSEEDIRRTAAAQRETPAEAAAKARATKTAELEVEQTKKLPGKRQVSLILGKMRNAYEQLEKAEAIPSEKRGGFSNAFDYLASSSLGREAQKFVGTEESKYLSQIVNLRKALATAIKNATGMSAQEMNSNTELMLTLDTLSDPTQGIEAARMALADLEELYGAPKPAAPAGPRRTPVVSGVPAAAIEHLRKNPSLRNAFDAKYGAGKAAKILGGK